MVNAQIGPQIEIGDFERVLNKIATSEGGHTPPSLLNINVMVQLLNELLAGSSSGRVSITTLADICDRSSMRPPASSAWNFDSIISIRLLIPILNAIENAGSGDTGSSENNCALSVNAVMSLLNAVAGKSSRMGGRGASTVQNTTRPLIGIDVLLHALNSFKSSTKDGGNRDCNVGQLNQLLQSEANAAAPNVSVGSVLNSAKIQHILQKVTYEHTRNSTKNNSLIRVTVLIAALNQILGGSAEGHGIHTGNDTLVSVDVGASLLNNISRTGGGLVGLVINFIRGLLGGLLGGQGGLLGGIQGSPLGGLLGGLLGGKGGLGGVLSGLLGGLLG